MRRPSVSASRGDASKPSAFGHVTCHIDLLCLGLLWEKLLVSAMRGKRNSIGHVMRQLLLRSVGSVDEAPVRGDRTIALHWVVCRQAEFTRICHQGLLAGKIWTRGEGVRVRRCSKRMWISYAICAAACPTCGVRRSMQLFSSYSMCNIGYSFCTTEWSHSTATRRSCIAA